MLALLGAAWTMCRRPHPPGFRLMLFAAAFYLAYFCFFVHVHIGLRYVLAIYPALAVCAGLGLKTLHGLNFKTKIARVLKGGLLVLLPAWILWQAAVIYPHHAEYFNEAVGGPYEGWRVLADSNLDWNQDDFIMHEWAEAEPRRVAVNPVFPTRGLIAIQATVLFGGSPSYAAITSWLRDHHEPRALVPDGRRVSASNQRSW